MYLNTWFSVGGTVLEADQEVETCWRKYGTEGRLWEFTASLTSRSVCFVFAVEDVISALCSSSHGQLLPRPPPPTPLQNFPLELLAQINSSVSQLWSVFYHANREVTNTASSLWGKTPESHPQRLCFSWSGI